MVETETSPEFADGVGKAVAIVALKSKCSLVGHPLTVVAVIETTGRTASVDETIRAHACYVVYGKRALFYAIEIEVIVHDKIEFAVSGKNARWYGLDCQDGCCAGANYGALEGRLVIEGSEWGIGSGRVYEPALYAAFGVEFAMNGLGYRIRCTYDCCYEKGIYEKKSNDGFQSHVILPFTIWGKVSFR